MSKYWIAIVIAVWLVAYPASLVSQTSSATPADSTVGSITGYARDSTGAPAAEAIVDLTAADNAHWHALVNSAGRFSFSNLPAGTYVVRVRRLGYRADYSVTRVVHGVSTPVEVILHMTPTQLTEVVIDAPIVSAVSGFDHRRQTGAGYYITSADIAKRQVIDFAGVMDLSPVLRVSRERGGPVITSTKPTLGGGYVCASILVNGRHLGPLAPFPEPRDIAGVETYRPNSGPAEFDGSCAIVLVWTKDYRGQ